MDFSRPVGVTIRRLLEEELPTLSISADPYRTRAPSTPSYGGIAGLLQTWDSFELEVLQHWRDHPPPSSSQALLYRVGNKRSPIEDEVYICGSEKACEARFIHQAIRPVQLAAEQLAENAPGAIDVKFADFKASAAGIGGNNKCPDFAGIEPQEHTLRFVGECKADFTNVIKSDFSDTVRHPPKRWLSQILKYMMTFKVQYGFVTTYNHTFFVQCAQFQHRPDGIMHLSDIVRFSRLISHDQSYVKSGAITVRQALWYLLFLASGETSSWRMEHKFGTEKGPYGTQGPR